MKDYQRWVDNQIKDLKLRSLLAQNMENVPKKLLKNIHKVSANASNDKGESLLICVVKYIPNDMQQVKYLNFLLRDGVDVDYQDKKMRTALMYCCIENKLAAANILINKSTTNLKLQDRMGNTALMFAAMTGMAYTVSILVDRLTRQWGWDVLRQKNCLGFTAEHLAKKNKHDKVVQLFAKQRLQMLSRMQKQLTLIHASSQLKGWSGYGNVMKTASTWKRKSIGQKDRFIELHALLHDDSETDILAYSPPGMRLRRTRTFSEGCFESKMRKKKSTRRAHALSLADISVISYIPSTK